MFSHLYKFALNSSFPLSRRIFSLLPAGAQRHLKNRVRAGMAERNLHHAPASALKAGIGTIETSGLDHTYAPGVNVVGFVRANLGLGVYARALLGSLTAADVPLAAINFTQGLQHVQNEDTYAHLIREKPAHIGNIFCFNADTLTLCHEAQPELFKNRYNIHYTAWELSKYPAGWMPAMNLVHEIWAISNFMQQAVAPYSTVPVVSMPIAVECAVTESHPRSFFGLPENTFLFLFSFDVSSVTERKNPEASLRAFAQAFPPERKEVGIAVKINFIPTRPDHLEKVKSLKKAWAHDTRVMFIEQALTRPAMVSLLAACDAYVSLHRAEGFGLGIAEAMYLQKPVIVTNYSGNTDFTRAHNACLVDYTLIPVKHGQYIFEEGQVWADADTGHAAHYMQKLVADKALCERLGAAGHATIRDEFSCKAIGLRVEERLKLLGLI